MSHVFPRDVHSSEDEAESYVGAVRNAARVEVPKKPTGRSQSSDAMLRKAPRGSDSEDGEADEEDGDDGDGDEDEDEDEEDFGGPVFKLLSKEIHSVSSISTAAAQGDSGEGMAGGDADHLVPSSPIGIPGSSFRVVLCLLSFGY